MKEKKKSYKENADLNLMKGNAPSNLLTNTIAVLSETLLYHFLMDQKNLEMFIYKFFRSCEQINGGFSFNCLFQIM